MKLAIIYMAAGQGRRFGGNKLLAPLFGIPLYRYGLRHVCEAARRAEAQCPSWRCQVYIVTAHEEIAAACRNEGVIVLRNHKAAEGMAASIRLGVETAHDADAWAFFAADQPFLKSRTIAEFLTFFLQSGKPLGCVVCSGVMGSPAVFTRCYEKELLSLSGDVGGRSVLRRHARDVWKYEAAVQELADIDFSDDMERARLFGKEVWEEEYRTR